MNWHNFKVISIYGIIACVFLFIVGEKDIAILALIGYPLYGLIVCINEFKKKKKLDAQLEDVSENIKQILICHIMKRSPKLKKRVERDIKADICNGNYKVASALLIDKSRVDPKESDADYDYYLTFDNNDKYEVTRNNYESSQVGDRLWVVATPTGTMRVIQSGEEYFNLFAYGLNYEEKHNFFATTDDDYFVK